MVANLKFHVTWTFLCDNSNAFLSASVRGQDVCKIYFLVLLPTEYSMVHLHGMNVLLHFPLNKKLQILSSHWDAGHSKRHQALLSGHHYWDSLPANSFQGKKTDMKECWTAPIDWTIGTVRVTGYSRLWHVVLTWFWCQNWHQNQWKPMSTLTTPFYKLSLSLVIQYVQTAVFPNIGISTLYYCYLISCLYY